jgi:hypothetical protein
MRYLTILALLALAASAACADELWNNGMPNGENGLASSEGYGAWVADDFELTTPCYLEDFWTHTLTLVTPGGYANIELWTFTANGPGDMVDSFYGVPLVNTRMSQYDGWGYMNYENRGNLGGYELAAGHYFFAFQMGQADICYTQTAVGNGNELYWKGEAWGVYDWVSATYEWGTPYNLSFGLEGTPVPEPGVVSLAGLLLGAGALWLRRK